ncbi:hypothetical protein L596_030377 [Steinernema carpocapsae]|uniref:Uncharacterized protein n=1 Tax=Steinernema carpocapsae TaxID=34508 RepID=A0A4U5LP75_STECR|nr:hypothetical protein L596_030377 [Steinernema carpocapsae]
MGFFDDIDKFFHSAVEKVIEATEEVLNNPVFPLILTVVVGTAAFVTVTVVIPAAAGALGFGAGGIAAGSTAATMMSWGGGVTPGFVSILQHIGATGLFACA